MNKVYITNEQDRLSVTPALRGLIRRAITQALKYEKFPYNAELSVTLTDNVGIRELNRKYRNIDRETDVLSFPLYEDGEIDDSEIIEGEPVSIGDIVLSLERAETQALEYGHSFEREAAFLCVHSVLHLLGYDHERGQAEEKEMFSRQEAILKKMKLERK
ncbi:MAG: rRNA maturation RNase YbeY [Clostridia bacterium]|nr:rRNA maturation RNase YbeY [Clostridia bacterium]